MSLGGSEFSTVNDIFCVINAHREGQVICATISSVKRAVLYATECGLNCQALVVLDNPDDITREIVLRECENFADVHEVNFRDLAYSRNYAAEISTAKYTSFVDGDDLWGKNWLVECYIVAEKSDKPIVLHPEYNIIFNCEHNHVFHHVDMDDSDFEFESLYRMNYWTALSFAETAIYKSHQYRKNNILEGFGYEDWTWNYETISHGITHKIAPGTVHFIRKGSLQDSLLAQTNNLNSLPRILNMYRRDLYITDDSGYRIEKMKGNQNCIYVVEETLDESSPEQLRKIA